MIEIQNVTKVYGKQTVYRVFLRRLKPEESMDWLESTAAGKRR